MPDRIGTNRVSRGTGAIRGLIMAVFLLLNFVGMGARAEDGYWLWLRYDELPQEMRSQYRGQLRQIVLETEETPTVSVAARELSDGLSGLLGRNVPVSDEGARGAILLVTGEAASLYDLDLSDLGEDGYLLRTLTDGRRKLTVIAANEDDGLLYGVFHLLRLVQTGEDISDLNITSVPRIDIRVLNHWDNLDRTVERGYAGQSIWDWHKLPDYIDPRYTDYARANASIGINGTVLTNVNANATVLTPPYIEKVAAVADTMRPYGIQVYLTARFSAPIEIGGLETADPADPAVQAWWAGKADEIYRKIPDFGGFLVKADSEGQPGPHTYHRTHAEGANMLADAVAPHGGVVMWRAFVYSENNPVDRHMQAYDQFVPLDGKFRSNVIIQTKNGAIDFQPREPFHPLFGAMPETPLGMEFQITKEYLGFATHLAYLAPMWSEVLRADTFVKGEGSTVAKIIDGSLEGHEISAMAGVSNIGSDRNWTGSQFDQANWYAFGRLAWDPAAEPAEIAEDWVRMTFTGDDGAVGTILGMMMESREAVVNYMTPLGLGHLMGTGHHYGPAPWVSELGRPEWNPVYYHKADEDGIGFDRTKSGSNAVAQYSDAVAAEFADLEAVPEEYLLWFHHVSWDYEMPSGRTLWEELVHRYTEGVRTVSGWRGEWASLEGRIDEGRYRQVADFLRVQEKEARWWRDACLAYFMSLNGLDLPAGYAPPARTLDEYKAMVFPSAPGN
ncbi:alpha-glucuronidase family glycosyl hydrolase [Parvularcula marina]|uniref:alpha-glucuronidase family glycosyl hydrolase n=1 Tax=Parvularcula marina TaxID=2292771 RepID=UPI0018F39DA0|nr:alpha-glucuronidase family glycosyl hydrolase [Parvularcula marina]